MSYEAFAVSTGVVALGEVGDKTQLLALLLAARWRAPWAMSAGILVATLANHLGAAALGSWLLAVIDPKTGKPAITQIFLREETYSDGGYRDIGPDLVAEATVLSGVAS